MSDIKGTRMKCKNLFKKLSKQQYLVLLLSFMVLMPNILATFIACDLPNFWSRILYLCGSVALFLFPALFIKSRVFFAVESLVLVLGMVEITHLIIYHASTSLLFVYTLMIAELGETIELITTGWFIVLGVLLIIGGYFWIIFGTLKNEYLLPWKWRRNLLIIIPVIGLSGIILLKWEEKSDFVPFPIHNEEIRTHTLTSIEKIFPLNIALATYHITHLRGTIEKQENLLKDFTFNIHPNNSSEEEILVLVMGETARYGNFGINGYERSTTPYLAQRTNLVSFDSIYAIANLTTVSVPFILSRATPETKDRFPNEKSIVEALAEGGYYTAWISNQSFGNEILMRISGTCDYTHYLPVDINNTTNLDIKLLDYVHPILKDTTHKKKFILLHSLGCHYKYNCRYPNEYAIFQPDLNSEMHVRRILQKYEINNLLNLKAIRKNKPLLNEVRQLLVNSYDNAILYTDYFLDSTISVLEQTNKPCAFIYIGDHGENLLDDERKMFLHGTYSGSEYEYHVPLFIWMSDEYKQKYPQKAAALLANKTQQTSSMTIFHTLLDMGNVQYQNLEQTKSLASDSLRRDSVIWGLNNNLELIRIPLQ